MINTEQVIPRPVIARHFISPYLFDSDGLHDSSNPEQSFAIELDQTRHVLVVDDIADVTDMLSVLLAQAGYRVTTANSAASALEVAGDNLFDVIISDIGMPDMNGLELAETLRTYPGYQSVPMIAVTGYAMFNDQKMSLAAGFTAHMTKPINPQALLDLIEQL